FGAFLGFIGVNLATVWQFYVIGQPGRKKNFFTDALVQGLGFLFCLVIWWGLATPAKIAGGIWFAVGLVHSAIRTRGFRIRPGMIDFSES
ncbi:MAG: APC family permease, partial [Acidobacteria bacterium]|nr:APC family permease [Acidobacteriota bacterium]